MDDSATHFTTVFMAFFAIMNPISNASLFLGLTDDLDSASRRAFKLQRLKTTLAAERPRWALPFHRWRSLAWRAQVQSRPR